MVPSSKRPSGKQNKLLLLAGLALGLFIGTSILANSAPTGAEKSLAVLLNDASTRANSGRTIKLVDTAERVSLYDGTELIAYANHRPDTDILEMLRDRQIATKVDFEVKQNGVRIESLIANLLMFAFFGLIAYTLLSGKVGGMAGLAKFTKAGAGVGVPDTTFKDVAGAESAKSEMQEIVEFLKDAKRWERLGARIPRGVLLSGPPGTGKTLLARAVAGEAKVPFFSISGSAFVELYVGVGAARVRSLFDQAKKHEPAIIFIDEIDAIGKQRGNNAIGSDTEQERALNQLLVEMDGFASSHHVIVIGATNRPDMLDSALLRPGRFDRRVNLDLPETGARLEILKVHTRNKPLASDVKLEGIARDTWNFSGADLANLANEAAIEAGRHLRDAINAADFEAAYERVLIGPTREGHSTPQERERIAIHELGHAIVAHLLAPTIDPVHKISIISRGPAGGYTRLRPDNDVHIYPKSRLLAQIAYGLGGHVAEGLYYDDPSTGGSDDLTKVAQLAWDMVCRYGMDDEVGQLVVEREQLLRDGGRTISEDLKAVVDARVRLIVEQARQLAMAKLAPYKDELKTLATTLIAEETMDLDRLIELLAQAESRRT